jgi:Tfp pilus assembly protein FimT
MGAERQCAGFGTLELLVSVSIAALLAGVTVPICKALLEGSRLRSQARLFAQHIDAFAAIAKLRERTVVVSVFPALYQLTNAAAGGELLSQHKLPQGITARAAEITLYPSGALSPGRVELRSGQRMCEVIVALRGRTTVLCEEE